jgi:hypothetical protein
MGFGHRGPALVMLATRSAVSKHAQRAEILRVRAQGRLEGCWKENARAARQFFGGNVPTRESAAALAVITGLRQ